jgi:site-specific DNA-methyltransferase (adenine-specific)
MIFAKHQKGPNIHHPRYYQMFEYMFVFVKGDGPRIWNPLFEINKNAGKARGKARGKTQRNGEKGYWGHSTHYRQESIKSNIWFYNIGTASGDDKIAFDHPAPFPEALARDHILTWTNPGDLVLDFFMGSGTTAKMAFINGRRFLGCDSSLEYVLNARSRIPETYTPDMFETRAPKAEPAQQMALDL